MFLNNLQNLFLASDYTTTTPSGISSNLHTITTKNIPPMLRPHRRLHVLTPRPFIKPPTPSPILFLGIHNFSHLNPFHSLPVSIDR
jgi:hypothetical protein